MNSVHYFEKYFDEFEDFIVVTTKLDLIPHIFEWFDGKTYVRENSFVADLRSDFLYQAISIHTEKRSQFWRIKKSRYNEDKLDYNSRHLENMILVQPDLYTLTFLDQNRLF